MQHTDLMESALASKPKAKSPKKTVRHMHVTKAHSGGYHIRHEYDHAAHEPTEHIAKDTAALHDHIDQNFADDAPAESASAGDESEQDLA